MGIVAWVMPVLCVVAALALLGYRTTEYSGPHWDQERKRTWGVS